MLALRQKVQEAMTKSKAPFEELYNVAHLFCLTLQLDLLKQQAESMNKLKNSFNITALNFDGSTLSINYWKYVN